MKVLKPKAAKEQKPLKFIGFDVETDPKDKNRFICACICCDDIQLVFYSEEDLITEISKKKYRGYKFIATNLPFDFFASFQDHSKHVGLTERNGRIYKMTFYQTVYYNENDELVRNHAISFYDTLNYIPASVEKLGKIVNNPKMDHPSFFPNKPKNQQELDELVEYCMNDALISYKFMQHIIAPWLEKNGLAYKMTIAGIAMTDFITNYLDEPLYQEDTETHKRCFGAYYGGRTEVFRRGLAKDVYCYDVNSLYPSVMLEEYPHPNKSKKIEKSNQYIVDNYEGVSKVKVFVPEMKIPPLPYRKSKGDKLIFPCGTFEGFYCHNELRNAIKYGVKILSFHEGVIYTDKKAFFKKFVLTHYEERKVHKSEGNPLEVMDKGVMNNLYGKFALNYTESSEIVHKCNKVNYDDVLSIVERGDYLLIKREGWDDPPEYSFPIFSAYVTAYARIKMYNYMVQCQDSILYTDTDSIFITEKRGSSDELGEFKLEDGYPVKNATFLKPKVYITMDYENKYKIKLKGMSRINKENWDKIMKGQTVYQERFMKHRTAIRNKLTTEDTRVNEVMIVPKTLSLEDDKRVWQNKFNPKVLEDSEPHILE